MAREQPAALLSPLGGDEGCRGRRRELSVTRRCTLLKGVGPSSEEQTQESFLFQVIFVSYLETTLVYLHPDNDVCYKHTILSSKFSRVGNQAWGFLTS